VKREIEVRFFCNKSDSRKCPRDKECKSMFKNSPDARKNNPKMQERDPAGLCDYYICPFLTIEMVGFK
jgi:hypothetical protein